MMDDATSSQNRAADPRFSTWLSANAGSGKTRVLTDRVARLLLRGTEPQHILCLTYTKAAASEMQNRLFQRLGKWAMLDDGALRKELADLDEEQPKSLAQARTLFARAVETPGGLKIQTIHSFCSSILRQFPLEAGVSQQFKELDENGQASVIDEVLNGLAKQGSVGLAGVSRFHSDESLTSLGQAIAKKRGNFAIPRSRADVFKAIGIPENLLMADVLKTALQADDLEFLVGISSILASSDSKTDLQLATDLAALPSTPSVSALRVLERRLLSGADTAKGSFVPKVGQIPTKKFRESVFQPYQTQFEAIMERIGLARQMRVGLESAEKTCALHLFANEFLPAYARTKASAGLLDFDDLIEKTRGLLTQRSLEWVLYRLDGGIEHILVDEAQDTSPAQWDVIDSIAREIISGEGARKGRTLFVVGDKKQSIYSFQGADAREFDRMARAFSSRLSDGSPLVRRDLQYSFRSSAAILSSVDTVFEGNAGRGLGDSVRHRAFHPQLPGRVDLWPLVPNPDKKEPAAWYDPVDRPSANDPRIKLAEAIAVCIQGLLDSVTILGKDGKSRRVKAGDILVLVQGRSDLFDHIIRACKSAGIPVAGADRLRISGELAVKDLLALMSFLALQEDNLSLAAALRSPLFGWTESELYDLAHQRTQKYLWAELRDRQSEFTETFAALNRLLGEVDFLRPYELLEMILTRHDGRKKLLERLGPEAEDGINELLNQALVYERDEVPSLTGFVARAQAAEIDIKRQSDTSGSLIRVMTVHGAKGLEAPIVILPDTTRTGSRQRDPMMIAEDGMPVWRMSKEECPDWLKAAREQAEQAEQEERSRLCYVAMTRAENWLIVCGVENTKSNESWYSTIDAGLRRLSHEPLNTAFGQGLRVSHGQWPEFVDYVEEVADFVKSDLPAFLSMPPPQPSAEDVVLRPSDLGGAKIAGGGALDEESALRYGRRVHRLLEHLPHSRRDRSAAQRIMATGPDGPAGDEIGNLFEEAIRVLNDHPDLFSKAALAEVDISAISPTLSRRIAGKIDRLIVQQERVVAVDFKTNAIVPNDPAWVPEGICRQMGAYLEVLEQVFPDHSIELQILWTRTSELMSLPHAIVRAALASTPTS